MPLLDKSPPVPDARAARASTSVRWRLPSVHPDGRKYIVAATALALFFWWIVDWDTLGWLTAGATVWLAAFFRDPIRTTPVAPDLVVAPADGLIVSIRTVTPPADLIGGDGLPPGPVVRVSIHISPFDCHVIRTPVAGALRRLAYVAGKLVNPALDKASEDNERQHLLVEAAGGERVGVTLIAGLVGRRIVCWVAAGDRVVAGQRVGMIRFGSRAEVYLPAGTGSQMLLGQRTVAGETVLARFGASELIEGVAQ